MNHTLNELELTGFIKTFAIGSLIDMDTLLELVAKIITINFITCLCSTVIMINFTYHFYMVITTPNLEKLEALVGLFMAFSPITLNNFTSLVIVEFIKVFDIDGFITCSFHT